ncbi:hypothetical protein [Streptomyces virginiae]|uniref:hypothetical protein n=1 Tax=Streptomyces virginiae TaxID=1961 RepID=UPI00370205DF
MTGGWGGETMLTLATRDSAGVLTPADTAPEQALSVEDRHFRMLQPREQLAAQRFPGDYIMRGNKTEQTQQAGKPRERQRRPVARGPSRRRPLTCQLSL